MDWLIVIALFVVSAVVLLYPLWIGTEEPLPVGIEGAADSESEDRADEKKRLLVNLRLLRSDFAEGKVAEPDFQRMEAEYEQQLAKLLEVGQQARARSDAAAQVVPRRDLHRLGSIVVLFLLAAGTFWSFYIHSRPPVPESGAAGPMMGGAQGAPDVKAMVARLEARLRDHPDDTQGALMLARSYATLGRREEAAKLWNGIIARDPANIEARSSLAVALLQAGDQASLKEAMAHLQTLRAAQPQEAAWLWYQGMALARMGRNAEAKVALQQVLTMVPPDSDNARMVLDALSQLGK